MKLTPLQKQSRRAWQLRALAYAGNEQPLTIVSPSSLLFSDGDQPYTMAGGEAISFADSLYNAADDAYTFTLTLGGSGTPVFTLAGVAGLTGSGNASDSLSYSGTLAAFNTAFGSTSTIDGLSGETVNITVNITHPGTGRTDDKIISVTSTAASGGSPIGLLLALTKAA